MIDVVYIATIISACTVIVGGILAVFKFYDSTKRQNKQQDKKIKKIQSEQALICYCVRAVLDGQHQQGCNGMVTDAIKRMDKHLNKAAHDE